MKWTRPRLTSSNECLWPALCVGGGRGIEVMWWTVVEEVSELQMAGAGAGGSVECREFKLSRQVQPNLDLKVQVPVQAQAQAGTID